MCVTPGVIEVLQTNFFNGFSLAHAIPGIDGDTAAMIVAESLEADRIWNLPPDLLLTGFAQGPECDFKSAVLAEMLFSTADMAYKEKRQEVERSLRALAMASLEKVARSPTASPPLWYEDIYFELAQGAQSDDPKEALAWLKRSLAHKWPDTYLEKGELECGLQMLTALLKQAPDDIWIYNLVGITFDRFGLTQIGIQG